MYACSTYWYVVAHNPLPSLHCSYAQQDQSTRVTTAVVSTPWVAVQEQDTRSPTCDDRGRADRRRVQEVAGRVGHAVRLHPAQDVLSPDSAVRGSRFNRVRVPARVRNRGFARVPLPLILGWFHGWYLVGLR